MASQIAGAWEEISETHESIVLATENYYCYVRTEKGRQPPSAERTTVELATLQRSLVAGAGTHRTAQSGDELIGTRTSKVASGPRLVGREFRQAWRFDGDEAHMEAIAADGSRGLSGDFRRVSGPGTSALAGAWELVSETHDGVLLRTDSHYASVVTQKNRALPVGERQTDTEVAEAFRTLTQAVAGTYTVEGAITTTRTLIDRDPRALGRESRREWRFEGDRAIGQQVRADGTKGETAIWRRIS